MSSAPPPPPPPPPPPLNRPVLPAPPSGKGAGRPHESTLGDMPAMDSAPPSGNFVVASLPLPPPPPPPPKIRSTTRPLTPPRAPRSPTEGISPLPPPPPPRAAPTKTSLPLQQQQQKQQEQQPSVPRTPPSLADELSPNNTGLEEEDVAMAAAATAAEDDMLTPPPRLPLTTFIPPVDPSKGPSLLARRHTHIPILVVATEHAQQLAWKNGLHLVDLFQGLVHDIHNILPPFRSIHKSFTLTDLPVQFVDDLMPYTYADAHTLLQDHARLQPADGNLSQELELLEDRVELLLQPGEDTLEQVIKDAYELTSPLNLPWLLRYRYALDASTDTLPHDLIQCPPLVLLVCTTEEVESPIQVLQELYNAPHVLPEAFKNGLLDPASMRHEVLVLHDNVEGPTQFNDNALRSTLQAQFGPQAHVLRINNVPPNVAAQLVEEETSDLWGGGGRLGNRLSVNDRVLFRRYFQSLFTSSLLPALERRVADLNTIVNERKKGVRNLVKSFWRKPKEDDFASSSSSSIFPSMGNANNNMINPSMTVLYRHDSVESQTRLLADTLFLIKDYDAALSTYRLIRDDFKSDKALLHYGSVQEMMALCIYHIDTYGRAKEIFSCFETAILSYTRAADEERRVIMAGKDPSARPPFAPHATRLATRLCLLLATASEALTKGRELEVADLLASASSHESSLGAAVLLEQSSAFYHEATMYRKYAFHMLMSGHMFRTANQDHHAFRCFTSALYIYRHGKWDELHNHLKSASAAQLYSMGRMSVALMLYAKLVEGSGKVSEKSQQKFLSHLLEICLDHPKKALVGADRMAVPPNIPTAREREALRNDHLERIVDVILHTPGATRVLELPYLHLPLILDDTVRIWTHAEEHFITTTTHVEEQTVSVETSVDAALITGNILGKSCRGDEAVWKDLQLLATAEWNAVGSTVRGLDETVTAALSKINDPDHRKVIAQIDKEKQSMALLARSRRNGNLKPQPAIRARREPIFCDFVLRNPLAVDIHLTQIQLVARMVDADDTICTNQDAISLSSSDNESSTDKTWTFSSTEYQSFKVADFCRISKKNQKASVSAKENAFFVVTKQDLQVPGGEELVVSAGLTPLVEGDLEILGVRCKLCDQVWVYHQFDIPGPLLNDTRSNRANRVRGEPLVLKSKVAADMPCITAELVKRNPLATTTPSSSSSIITDNSGSDDGPLLEGQISSWTIRLRNVGSAPACQAILKTNLPWINIPRNNSNKTKGTDKNSSRVLESQATSNCIGPTGTMVELPLEGSHLTNMGTLYPGETIDIPIQIRTSGSGKQHFYMLYRYALYDERNDLSRPTRWLRKMYEVPVFPSLVLSTHLMASFWKFNEQILSVDLANIRTDRPIDLFLTLDKLALVSRHYRLEVLPGQYSTSDQNGNVLQIGWQERVTVHFRVVPVEDENPSCQLSECPFRQEAMATHQDCINTNIADFFCLERAFETFEAAWTQHKNELLRAEHDLEGENHPRSIASIRRANTSESTGLPDFGDPEMDIHPTSLGKLCPTNDSKLNIICNWRAILGDEVIQGEHQMRALSVRPKSYFTTCPVHATATYPSTVLHDFSKGPAMVPVMITLCNRLLESPVEFLLSAEKQQGWEVIGFDVLQLSLEPSESTEIPVDALIPKAGIHNLQALQVTLKQQGEELPFLFSHQWLVHVTDRSD